MKNFILYALAILITTAACNSGSSGEDEAQSSTAVNHQDMPSNNKQKMDMNKNVKSITVPQSNISSDILDAYLKVKNALADDDQSAASEAGSRLAANAASVDLDETMDQSQEVKEILDVVKEHGEHIAESDIDHQREHFAMMNKDIMDLIKIVGSDRALYEQFCPMYDNNKGGAWLSISEQIQNPLFGSQMPKCGEVQQIITMQ